MDKLEFVVSNLSAILPLLLILGVLECRKAVILLNPHTRKANSYIFG